MLKRALVADTIRSLLCLNGLWVGATSYNAHDGHVAIASPRDFAVGSAFSN